MCVQLLVEVLKFLNYYYYYIQIDTLTTTSSIFEAYIPLKKMVACYFALLVLLDAEKNKRICFLNVSPDEVIRSLFYNKNNDSLITVSVYASDNFSSLKCRSTRIECADHFIIIFLSL